METDIELLDSFFLDLINNDNYKQRLERYARLLLIPENDYNNLIVNKTIKYCNIHSEGGGYYTQWYLFVNNNNYYFIFKTDINKIVKWSFRQASLSELTII
jgi:hypothetical protein